MLREYMWLASTATLDWRFVVPMIVTPFSTTVWPGLQSSQLPPCSAARSTMTEPGRIPRTISAVMRMGARRPGMSAVVMQASDLAMWRFTASACFCFSSSVISLA